MSEVTRIIERINDGTGSPDELIPLVYDELRRMAAGRVAQERPGQTLNATALVHEAYLRLADQSFDSRRHFFGASSEAMRRILIDRARVRNAQKRGGRIHRTHLDVDQIAETILDLDPLEALDRALKRFEAIEPDKAELVKLRYFVGLTIREAAEVLGISTATADRQWNYARAWLQTELRQSN